MTGRKKVAVIGLGSCGLTTVKNLLEEGFEPVGFERNDYVGGLWKYTEDPTITSTLKSTVANISKQRNVYTDFPFPDDVPSHPTAAQTHEYLEAYADHFNLRPHFRLSTTVEGIERSDEDNKWIVKFRTKDSGSQTESFDRLVLANGTYNKPFTPKIPGIEKFEGEILHSQAFKDPSKFKGKNVLVVGFSNTGADVTVELSAVASKVYIAHRSGARVLRRVTVDGAPVDHLATRTLLYYANLLGHYLPRLHGALMSRVAERSMRASFPELRDEWRLLPAPPFSHHPAVANEHIIGLLAAGRVASVAGVRAVAGPRALELDDGRVVAGLDAVVFCTGYGYDFGLLPDGASPTAAAPGDTFDTAAFRDAGFSNGQRFARLYQGVLSTRYPHSLAVLGHYVVIGAFAGADVASQALAQLWLDDDDDDDDDGAGGGEGRRRRRCPMPTAAEMERWCAAHYRGALAASRAGTSSKAYVEAAGVERWLNEVAGNGVNEMTGGWLSGPCWALWWRDRETWDMVMKGPDTAFVYRLWEGARGERRSRKRWEGAMEAIRRANGKEPVGAGGDEESRKKR